MCEKEREWVERERVRERERIRERERERERERVNEKVSKRERKKDRERVLDLMAVDQIHEFLLHLLQSYILHNIIIIIILGD